MSYRLQWEPRTLCTRTQWICRLLSFAMYQKIPSEKRAGLIGLVKSTKNTGQRYGRTACIQVNPPLVSSLTGSPLASYTSRRNPTKSVPLPWCPAFNSSRADWNRTSIAMSYCPDFVYLEAKVLAFWWASYGCPAAIKGKIAFKAREEDAVALDIGSEAWHKVR